MLNMYNLGVHLRKVYGEFLGDLYMSQTMKMQTAEYPLSMLSGQLVNAGLWPPAEIQRWSADINWQPISTGKNFIHFSFVNFYQIMKYSNKYCP